MYRAYNYEKPMVKKREAELKQREAELKQAELVQKHQEQEENQKKAEKAQRAAENKVWCIKIALGGIVYTSACVAMGYSHPSLPDIGEYMQNITSYFNSTLIY